MISAKGCAKIAAFNIENFGQKKANDQLNMGRIVKVIIQTSICNFITCIYDGIIVEQMSAKLFKCWSKHQNWHKYPSGTTIWISLVATWIFKMATLFPDSCHRHTIFIRRIFQMMMLATKLAPILKRSHFSQTNIYPWCLAIVQDGCHWNENTFPTRGIVTIVMKHQHWHKHIFETIWNHYSKKVH